MKNTVKFKWGGSTENEVGLATYEVGTSTYSLRLPNFHSAHFVYMALRDVYEQGYMDGVCGAKTVVQSALSELLK